MPCHRPACRAINESPRHLRRKRRTGKRKALRTRDAEERNSRFPGSSGPTSASPGHGPVTRAWSILTATSGASTGRPWGNGPCGGGTRRAEVPGQRGPPDPLAHSPCQYPDTRAKIHVPANSGQRPDGRGETGLAGRGREGKEDPAIGVLRTPLRIFPVAARIPGQRPTFLPSPAKGRTVGGERVLRGEDAKGEGTRPTGKALWTPASAR